MLRFWNIIVIVFVLVNQSKVNQTSTMTMELQKTNKTPLLIVRTEKEELLQWLYYKTRLFKYIVIYTKEQYG